MDIASLFILATLLFVAAALPGPDIAAIVARLLARGPEGAVAFALGVGLGDLVWLTFAVGGLSVLAQTFHGLFQAVKWAGIASLLLLARKMRSAPANAVDEGAPPVEARWAPLLAGLSVTS